MAEHNTCSEPCTWAAAASQGVHSTGHSGFMTDAEMLQCMLDGQNRLKTRRSQGKVWVKSSVEPEPASACK